MAEIKKPKSFNYLTAISSIDGRFRGRVEEISKYFSEMAVIKGRVFVEIEYLIAFLAEIGKPLSLSQKKSLRKVASQFDEADAEIVWKKDLEINHDTKAVEYFLGQKLEELKLQVLRNFLHFGLTSTDIDNTAFSLSLSEFRAEVLLPSLKNLISVLQKLAKENKNLVMLARTHGQVAVPTTAGKEMANFRNRLAVQLDKLAKLKIGSKISGAVGNHNALVAAYPNKNWLKFSKKFINSLGLEFYPMSTQVEPYDYKVDFIQTIKRINLIVGALDEDVWRYLALGYLSLRDEKGHVGSSTMPQKINPIGFEMSENYTNLANGLLDIFEKRLPLNRWQRDLTDKYLLRDLGLAMAMSFLAYDSTAKALKQIGFNKELIGQDLENHWESIAEGIQTILRTTDYTQPYEKLKELTRGKKFTKEDYEKFIEEIDVADEVKDKLRKLSPQTYTGLAKKLAG
ncbi:adenylosuccinate lyase [Microgenomates group bacterium RBG_19FT_COMBO_39_10]|nr:MAG: adenylosuccinate lyase [Microgenomates group bacterium RBG_19FT_COMBO_39_10]